uniref:EGF-like domain-containing protein n=1 Tax=Myotis lucifugus TaxID=59463 RepID=G1Q6V7_MYOLU
CLDVDECSSSPSKCGPNSVCKNLPGRYKCSCLPGFSSPTGDNWSPEKPGHFSCTDVDECLDSGVCPEHSECANSLGSYSCHCQDGFIFNNSLCEDIDECLDMCPFNATCTNTLGNYFCTCHPGFAPSNGRLNFTEQEVECGDIDECVQDPSPCGPNSVCTNALGSYSCGCIVGFRPNPEGSWKYGNFSCKRVPFKCKEDVIPNNKQVLLCQVGTAVEPEDVS